MDRSQDKSASQLRKLSEAVAHVLQAQHVPPEFASYLQVLFPEAGYVSVTTVGVGAGGSELHEHYSLLASGALQCATSLAASPSVSALVVSDSQHRYYDEAVHTAETRLLDFTRLLTQYDCTSIISVPLPCHSRLASPRATGACAHCHKRLELASHALGCLTLGVRRGANFPIRDYLSKMIALAAHLGPRLLAPAKPPAPPAPAAAAAAAAASALQQQQNTLLHMALGSSFYAPTSAPPQAGLPPVSAASRMSYDSSTLAMGRLLGQQGYGAYAGGDAGAYARHSIDARMSLDSQASTLSSHGMCMGRSASIDLGGGGVMQLPSMPQRFYSLFSPVSEAEAAAPAAVPMAVAPFPGMAQVAGGAAVPGMQPTLPPLTGVNQADASSNDSLTLLTALYELQQQQRSQEYASALPLPRMSFG